MAPGPNRSNCRMSYVQCALANGMEQNVLHVLSPVHVGLRESCTVIPEVQVDPQRAEKERASSSSKKTSKTDMDKTSGHKSLLRKAKPARPSRGLNPLLLREPTWCRPGPHGQPKADDRGGGALASGAELGALLKASSNAACTWGEHSESVGSGTCNWTSSQL